MPLNPTAYFKQTGLVPFYDAEDALRYPVKLAPSTTYFQGQLLGELVGLAEIDTATVTATGGTFTLSLGGYTTTALAWNATAAQVQAALLLLPSLGANSVHKLAETGTVTGGTFTLSYNGGITAPIAWNATAAQVAAAVQALSTISGGTVTGSGGPLPGTPVTLTFSGSLSGVPIPVGLGIVSSLIGTTPTITDTVVNPGGANGQGVSVTLPSAGLYTIAFQNDEAYTAQVLTASGALLTGGSTTVPVAQVAIGSPGTPGTFAAYGIGNTNGSQVPRCINEYTCTTDAAGNITLGTGSTGGEHGETWLSVPAYWAGTFATQELVGLDQNALNLMSAHLISGTFTNGVARFG